MRLIVVMKIAINDIFIEHLIHDPRYEIRANGTVWTTICRTGKQSLTGTWRQLAFVVSDSGHLSIKYRRKHLCIHRVIYRKFLGPLREDYAVNHIDGEKRNNTPQNLELITHSENMLHCWRVLGHVPMKPRKKIDQETAEQMRIEYSAGATNRELRQKYGLAKATVSYIVNGRTWKTN
jgi:hypothetical protein